MRAKTMFIGLCPGRNGADLTGVPFTKDPSGKVFFEVLDELGYLNGGSPDRPLIRGAYVTNLVKCCPKDNLGRNRCPSSIEISSCEEYLRAEIDILKPTLILTLGRVATELVLGRRITKFSDIHLKRIVKKDRTVVPLFHPSFVVRGAYPRSRYLRELGRLANLTPTSK